MSTVFKVRLLFQMFCLDSRVLGFLEKHLKNCTSQAVILVCNHDKLPDLPVTLHSLATYRFEIPALDEKDRESVIRHQLIGANFVDVALINRHTSVGCLIEFFVVNYEVSLLYVLIMKPAA